MEEKIENKTENIRDCLNSINDVLEEIDNLANVDDSRVIKNVDDFIWRLKLDNLYNTELENFINDYLKYYNE